MALSRRACRLPQCGTGCRPRISRFGADPGGMGQIDRTLGMDMSSTDILPHPHFRSVTENVVDAAVRCAGALGVIFVDRQCDPLPTHDDRGWACACVKAVLRLPRTGWRRVSGRRGRGYKVRPTAGVRPSAGCSRRVRELSKPSATTKGGAARA